jgi:hypothetical protein
VRKAHPEAITPVAQLETCETCRNLVTYVADFQTGRLYTPGEALDLHLLRHLVEDLPDTLAG